jgi:SOS-response transcriptional repressor LexA
VYTWDNLDELYSNNFILPTEENIFISGGYSKKTFGVVMSDSSMTPFFPKDSILIIDPERTANDRSYVIAYLHDVKRYLFRQLLSDGENFFLKALNSDLSSFPIRKLHQDDKIIGELVETRQIYAKSLKEDSHA